ncbi:MAG: hypothetical protein GWP32_08830 [Bacteroidetes bacterium]|nr:hypothetical protein [Bacteroidota bacterium]
MNISSDQIVYSEHNIDECFEYKDGGGRVPDGIAIGYLSFLFPNDLKVTKLVLVSDIKYSECDHQYWNNLELEHDVDRIVIG